MASRAERFNQLFNGLKRAFGQYIIAPGTRADARGKIEGKAVTWSSRLLDLSDWEAHLAGSRGLGICPLTDDDACWFGSIDIDIYPLDHREVYAACEKIGVPLILCRTKSSGIHGHVFFSEPVPAALLRERLQRWSALIGHLGCEVFPKQDTLDVLSFGNWINMPYYGGEDSLRYAYGPEAAYTIDEFLDRAEASRVSLSWLESWECQEPEEPSQFGEDSDIYEAPPCIQYLTLNDGFRAGARNNGFHGVSVYHKKRLQGKNWKDAAKAFNQRHFDPPLRIDEMKDTLNSVGRRDYNYMCNKSPLSNCCDRSRCLKRKFGVGNGGDHEEGAEGVDLDIGQLTKILSEPPTWRLIVNGRTVELDTEEMLNQGRFMLRVTAVTNVIGKAMKQPIWHRLLQQRLDEVEELTVPKEAELRNQVQHFLVEFCSSKAQARTIDELLVKGLPWTDDGRTYFMPNDFIEYLSARKVGFARHKLTAIMHDLGCREQRGMLHGRLCSYWSVPEPSKQTDPFDTPRLKEEEPF